VELYGSPNCGGMIRVWKPANQDDIDSEERLSHIYTVTEDKKYTLFGEIHFMHFANAREEYRELHTVRDALNLVRRDSLL